MERVLVTGGNGFIGSHLVESLVKKGVSVRCLVRKTSDLKWLNGIDIEWVQGDLKSFDSLLPAVKDVDVVFHLGGRTKVHANEDYHEANARGTENLMKAILKEDSKINRFVYVSSQAVAGPSSTGTPVKESDTPNPLTPYGKSKLAGEETALKYKSQLPITVVRPPTVYGPRDMDVYEVFKIVKYGFKAVLGWRKRYFSMIYVEDLVEGLLLAAENKNAIGQIFFMVSDECVDYKQFVNHVASALKKKALFIHVPLSVFTLSVFILEIIATIRDKPLIINRYKVKEAMNPYWICSGLKAKRLIGFIPKYGLDEGIRKTADWYQKEGWL